MASGSEAIEALSPVTGIGPVAQLGRVLRESDQDFWPKGTRGRGDRPTDHVTSRHLAAMGLALTADPAAKAPVQVAEMMGMVPETGGLMRSEAFLPGTTFGAAFINLIEYLEKDSNAPDHGRYQFPAISVVRINGQVQCVEMRAQNWANKHAPFLCRYVSKAAPAEQPEVALRVETTLPPPLLYKLADLWHDTRLAQEPGHVPVNPRNRDLISIAHVGLSLEPLTGHRGISPRKIYALALRGAIPATNERGRWYVRRNDLPKVAEVLRLPLLSAAEQAALLRPDAYSDSSEPPGNGPAAEQ